jgi:hypothetical protein
LTTFQKVAKSKTTKSRISQSQISLHMEEKKPKKAAKKKQKIDKLNMGINEFGELTTNINLDEINNFLNDAVEDKKLNEKADKKTKKG